MMLSRCALLLLGAAGIASCSASLARADEKGEKILQEAYQKLYAAKTYSADLNMVTKSPGKPDTEQKAHVQAQKPNLLRYQAMAVKDGKNAAQVVSDGKNVYTFPVLNNMYMRQQVAAEPENLPGNWEGEVDAFFGGVKLLSQVSADYAGTDIVDGVPCDLVKTKTTDAQNQRIITYAIGQKDHLIHRSTWQYPNQPTVSNIVSNIRLGGEVAAAQFAFAPPKGATEYSPEAMMRKLEENLVAVGEEAPPFEATDPVTNSRFSLAQMMDKKKAVLVNFWFYG
jgi:outer membrane lipoprotein-sorting protein